MIAGHHDWAKDIRISLLSLHGLCPGDSATILQFIRRPALPITRGAGRSHHSAAPWQHLLTTSLGDLMRAKRHISLHVLISLGLCAALSAPAAAAPGAGGGAQEQGVTS